MTKKAVAPRIWKKQTVRQPVEMYSAGDWVVDLLDAVSHPMQQLVRSLRNQPVQWDVSGIGRIDSTGMLLVLQALDALHQQGCRVEVKGQDTEFARLYDLLQKYRQNQAALVKPKTPSAINKFFESIGKRCVEKVHLFSIFLAFIGESFVHLLYSLRHPAAFRLGAVVKNIEDAGYRALPIIALTSFLIGVVIAYQGAVQLEKFGANIFIVDMIGISITRELAPLITAIVLAGRTGSAYTAQLGVMKLTEEIDAMRTMGFEPYRFLVLPRMFGLMLALPLLIFFADIIGIAGGMLISNLHLNISFNEFIHRLQNVLPLKHVWIGIGKGPFFAWLIALVGCFNGFQVAKDTESIGRYTTISVVNAIFLVIACDAVFSVILTELGI